MNVDVEHFDEFGDSEFAVNHDEATTEKLENLNRITETIRERGMSKEQFVAIESIVPGLLSESGIDSRKLTERLSSTMQNETLVALENDAVKVLGGVAVTGGLTMLLVKFFKWLADKFSGGSGRSGSVLKDDIKQEEFVKSIANYEKRIEQSIQNIKKSSIDADAILNKSENKDGKKFNIGKDSNKLLLVDYLEKKLDNNSEKDKIINEALKFSIKDNAVRAMLASSDAVKFSDIEYDYGANRKVVDAVLAALNTIDKRLAVIIRDVEKKPDAETFANNFSGLIEIVNKDLSVISEMYDPERSDASRGNHRVTLLNTDKDIVKIDGRVIKRIENMFGNKDISALTELGKDVINTKSRIDTTLESINKQLDGLKISDESGGESLSFGERLLAISNKNSSHGKRMEGLTGTNKEAAAFNKVLSKGQSEIIKKLKTASSTFWMIGNTVDRNVEHVKRLASIHEALDKIYQKYFDETETIVI